MTLIEIFKAGKRLDANGVEVEITIDDLQQALQEAERIVTEFINR